MSQSITLCVVSQRVFIVVVVYFVMTQSGNFWIYARLFVHWTNTWKSRRNWNDNVKLDIGEIGDVQDVQELSGALSLGVKRPGREADHSPPSSAEVKE